MAQSSLLHRKVEAPDEKGDTQLWVIEGAAPAQCPRGA